MVSLPHMIAYFYFISSLYSLMVKTGDYQWIWLLKRRLKASEKPRKVHLKWNSTLNLNLNVQLTFHD